jgi:hypothetical protein
LHGSMFQSISAKYSLQNLPPMMDLLTLSYLWHFILSWKDHVPLPSKTGFLLDGYVIHLRCIFISEPFSPLSFHFPDQVILGVVMGALFGVSQTLMVVGFSISRWNSGLLFSYLMKFAHRRGFIDRESYVAQYLALAILTTGIVSSLGSDDLLAAFAAGSYGCECT